ncbi:Protein of unknown function [Gryllus bimaculatus]|nr:Protein of unknown function [Gryllus bimaculatus]
MPQRSWLPFQLEEKNKKLLIVTEEF